MITVGEHTFDERFLTRSVVLDVGCRGFVFSQQLLKYGCRVVGFDLQHMSPPPGIEFFEYAISNVAGESRYVDTSDQQAKYLDSLHGEKTVFTKTLNQIYEVFGEQIDILKLDCEGSEYDIIADDNWQPIPRQITIEFHAHCHKQKHSLLYQKVFDKLCNDYVPVQHKWTAQHGAGYNYWDSLFIRKDLYK